MNAVNTRKCGYRVQLEVFNGVPNILIQFISDNREKPEDVGVYMSLSDCKKFADKIHNTIKMALDSVDERGLTKQ